MFGLTVLLLSINQNKADITKTVFDIFIKDIYI